MDSPNLSEYRFEVASHLQKLAIRTTRLSYREIPVPSFVEVTSSSAGLSEVAGNGSSPSVASKEKERIENDLPELEWHTFGPLVGKPRLQYVEAAKVSGGIRVNLLFGPIHLDFSGRSVAVGVGKHALASMPGVFDRIFAFGSFSKMSIVTRDMDPNSGEGYRIEKTGVSDKNTEQYVIVHSKGPSKGKTVHLKSGGPHGDVYSPAVYGSAAEATRSLTLLNTGISLSSRDVGPKDNSVILMYSFVATKSDDKADVYHRLVDLLSAVESNV